MEALVALVVRSNTLEEFKYVIALKAVVLAGGIDGLDDTRKSIFQGTLQFIAHLIKASNEVSAADITDDFSIIVTADSEVEETLKKIGDSVIVKRL